MPNNFFPWIICVSRIVKNEDNVLSFNCAEKEKVCRNTKIRSLLISSYFNRSVNIKRFEWVWVWLSRYGRILTRRGDCFISLPTFVRQCCRFNNITQLMTRHYSLSTILMARTTIPRRGCRYIGALCLRFKLPRRYLFVHL